MFLYVFHEKQMTAPGNIMVLTDGNKATVVDTSYERHMVQVIEGLKLKHVATKRREDRKTDNYI